MIKDVIVPYTADRITPQDIAQLAAAASARDPQIRLRGFEATCLPLWLADPFGPQTVTVTLSNNGRPDIFEYIPGPQFFATNRSKTQLLAALLKAGIPVPHSMSYRADMDLPQDRFGPYMAIKTSAPGTVRGSGIAVCKTADFERIRGSIQKAYAREIAAGYAPVLQQYVPSGPKPCHTRVTTFLGAPIVCFQTVAPNAFDPAALKGMAGGEATSNFSPQRTRQLVDDPGMVDLARKVAQVFPETAVLSIDIVRSVETGALYCLEANLGNLSVLSAPVCDGLRADLGTDAMLRQFGAYDAMAREIAVKLQA